MMNSFGAEGTTRSIFTGLVASLRHLMKWGDNDPSTSDILNVLLPSLLVELRQRSVRGSLSGSNPFERFRTFETSCSTEEYAFELASVRPELIERIHATSERRHRFESWVNECAKEDHYALVQCGMINDYAVPEFDLQSVSGDWHNDKPTVKVKYGEKTLYLKNRTSDNELLVRDIWEILSRHADKRSLLDLHGQNVYQKKLIPGAKPSLGYRCAPHLKRTITIADLASCCLLLTH